MTVDVFTLRGTGEIRDRTGRPSGMIANLTDLLDARTYRCIDVDYPAGIGPANPFWNPFGVSMQASIDAGVDALARHIRATPNLAALIGYSLGALTITRFLERKARGEFADCHIAWVILIANPARALGDSVDGVATGYGIVGQHGRWPQGLPVFELASPGDPITSLQSWNPMRTVADQVTFLSLSDLARWGTDLLDRALHGRWQPVLPDYATLLVTRAEAIRGGAHALGAYLFGGAHIGAYLKPMPYSNVTYIERGAQLANGWARGLHRAA
jgi:predicted alpha/beta hydrolase family esterase